MLWVSSNLFTNFCHHNININPPQKGRKLFFHNFENKLKLQTSQYYSSVLQNTIKTDKKAYRTSIVPMWSNSNPIWSNSNINPYQKFLHFLLETLKQEDGGCTECKGKVHPSFRERNALWTEIWSFLGKIKSTKHQFIVNLESAAALQQAYPQGSQQSCLVVVAHRM
jgi:hypothetical protein